MLKLFKAAINFKSILKCCGTQNRNIYILYRPIPKMLCIQDLGQHSKSIVGSNVDQRRTYSLENLKEFNESMYNYVVTSEISLHLKNALIALHDLTGLPWWSTIILTAGAVKMSVGFPLGAFQQNVVAKVVLTKIELDKICKEKIEPDVLLRAKRGKWPDFKVVRCIAFEKNKIWKTLVVKNNCHPFKITLVSLVQLPIWVILSYNFKNLVDSKNPTVPFLTKVELQTEGVWWNTDLSLPDSFLILPAALFLSTLALIEINCLSTTNRGGIFKFTIFALRAFSVLTFIVGINTPACLTLYWTSSLLFGLNINLLLMNPKIRRLCMIPKTPVEKENPYKHLTVEFKKKYFSYFSGKKSS